VDDAGRRQYIYHDEWRHERDGQKHDRVLELACLLPAWRIRVNEELVGRGLGKRRILAAALFMLDRGIFRTGNERYTEDHGTYGVATLLREHVHVHGDECFFRYPAKGGIERTVSIRDSALAAATNALLRSRSDSDRLLRYRDPTDWRDVTAAEINDLFKQMVGQEFTAKDLRTWNATVLAATALAQAPSAASQRARGRAIAAAMREVAEGLGNTPAVARNSYVDPRVIRCYEKGETIRAALRRLDGQKLRPEAGREKIEKTLIRMLNRMR
jgi:DNA topoisomerase IB